jgi:apolipoprotein N-acyltransferase
VALAPLILSVISTGPVATLSRAFLLGVTTGLVYFAGTLYWLAETMQLHGGLPLPVSVLIAALLVSYLAIFPGLFAVLVAGAVRRLGVAGVWLTPALWVSTEWLRASLGPGFPWVQLGASQATVVPVVQLTSVVGLYGLSALVALVSAAAVVATVSRRRTMRGGVVLVAMLLVGVVGWGSARVSQERLLAEGEEVRVGLVQGAIAQERKWDPRYSRDIVATYLELSRQVIAGGARIVIWPEASTPFPLDADSLLAAPIRQLAEESGLPFIIGSDQIEAGTDGAPDRYYNAAVLVGPDGRSHQWYRKMRLAPFGEYVPLKSLLFFVGPLVEKVSDFTPGTEAVVFNAGGRRVSVAICYESVYGTIAQQFVDNGSTLLATITNDAWFGRTSAPHQHFEQGAIRAVEQGRFVVRAANTGISGAVDPYGRVIATTRLFEPAALSVDVRLLTERTIYSRMGDVAVWAALAVSIWLAAWMFTTRRQNADLFRA